MVRGIANSKIGFGDLILLLRYFFKLKVSTHPKELKKNQKNYDLHPSLDPDNPSHAPELLVAIEVWEKKYQNNEYPYMEHTPAITNILKNKGITQTNLVKRICAITNIKSNKSKN
ncbi:hypothetical protein MMP74_19120, partial [Acinetobacter sp. NIPH 1869]|nr:hypothetical protein [Acinetobacter higginsii]